MKSTTFRINGLNIIIPIWSYAFFIFCVFSAIMTNLKPLIYIAMYESLIIAHELGHYIVSRILKNRSHSIILTPFIGYCVVDEFYSTKDQIIIYWGGIFMQLFILFISLVIILLFNSMITKYVLDGIKGIYIGANAFLIIVNLLPIFPLDGAIAWKFINSNGLNKNSIFRVNNREVKNVIKQIGKEMKKKSI